MQKGKRDKSMSDEKGDVKSILKDKPKGRRNLGALTKQWSWKSGDMTGQKKQSVALQN